jgi:hypothetical protein
MRALFLCLAFLFCTFAYWRSSFGLHGYRVPEEEGFDCGRVFSVWVELDEQGLPRMPNLQLPTKAHGQENDLLCHEKYDG